MSSLLPCDTAMPIPASLIHATTSAHVQLLRSAIEASEQPTASLLQSHPQSDGRTGGAVDRYA